MSVKKQLKNEYQHANIKNVQKLLTKVIKHNTDIHITFRFTV